MKTLNILLLEDVEADYLLIAQHINKSSLKATLHWVKDDPSLVAALKKGSWDLVLSDYKAIGIEFTEILKLLRDQFVDVPVILVSRQINEERVVELLETGMTDVIFKDSIVRLIPTIRRCLKEVSEQRKRKENDAKLVRNEQLMQAVLGGTTDAISIKDRNGRYLILNDVAARMTGWDAIDVIGHDDNFIFPPELANRIKKGDSAIMASGRSKRQEEELQSFNGEKLVCLVTKGPVFDQHGQVNGIFSIAREIIDRKQTNAQMKEKESEQRRLSKEYRALLDNVPDGIVHLSPDLQIRWVNKAAQKMFGLDKKESYCGKCCHEIFWNKAERCTACPVVRSISTCCHEMDHFSQIGDDRELEIKAVPMINQAGDLEGVIEIISDMTSHRKLEARLQQAQKMEAIGTLAGGIAHDFNNILGAIIGYAEMALDDCPAGSMIAHDIRQVLKAGKRAKEVVKQILTFSRQTTTSKIPLNPATIINETIKLLRPSLPTTISINHDIDRDAGIIQADPNQIHQILMNLCTNAFHSMEMKGGTLTISLKKKVVSKEYLSTEPILQPGNYLQLSVRDTGKGIVTEIRNKIFNPYFTTKEAGKGTGMGLAIVRGIVQSYGGSVTCESRVGEGTVFNIMLPSIEDHALPEDDTADIILTGNERILFIDDEVMLAEVGKEMLEQLGYRVTARTNALEALTTFQNQPETFDLVITDQTMPGITGVDLSRRILQIRPDMPIILCTGYSSQISEEEAMSLGIKGFVMKPFGKKGIASLIRKIIDKGSAGTREFLTM